MIRLILSAIILIPLGVCKTNNICSERFQSNHELQACNKGVKFALADGDNDSIAKEIDSKCNGFTSTLKIKKNEINLDQAKDACLYGWWHQSTKGEKWTIYPPPE